MSDPSPKRFQIGWQVYVAAGLVGHWTKADQYRELVRYKAPCADPRCSGRLFEAVTCKAFWRKHVVNRRCRQHRDPGMRVDNERPPVPITTLPPGFRPASKKCQRKPAQRRYEKGSAVEKRSVKAVAAASRPMKVDRRTKSAQEARQAAPRPSYLD